MTFRPIGSSDTKNENLNPDALRCWLALQRVAGLSATSLDALFQHFDSVQAVFSASRSELQSVLTGDQAPVVDAILRGPTTSALASTLAWVAQANHRLVTFQDPNYPQLLREIARPPVILFVVGDPEQLVTPQLAIVGSRNPTPSGLENAASFARALSHSGLTVTSGLALGIDGAAHEGALEAGGRTVAVLGSGVDQVYPARHRQLATRIAENGALVSEFELGTPPKAEHFPRRNRIISGLSLGTLVVEAAIRSGSLITARCAVEQGREVFAVPGSIHAPQARGCHSLIRQGAKLVETAQDVIEEISALTPLTRQPVAKGQDQHSEIQDPKMTELLDHLGYDPATIDTLVERSGLTADFISSMLLEMELLGMVEARPGGRYVRV